jgi:hypothetical protein
MPITYTPIATYTAPSAQANVTFSSISGTYTDLILVVDATTTLGNRALQVVLNSDTGSNYSATYITGDGSSTSSSRNSNTGYAETYASIGNTTRSTVILQFQNYSNATTFKKILCRSSIADLNVRASVNLWRATPVAISNILLRLNADNFNTGSTFTLYGILAA